MRKKWSQKNIAKMPTTPGIRKRSPIQLLTRPDDVWLRGSDENRYIQHGMVIGDEEQKYLKRLQPDWVGREGAPPNDVSGPSDPALPLRVHTVWRNNDMEMVTTQCYLETVGGA